MTTVAWYTGTHIATATLMAGGSIVAGVVMAAGDGGAAVVASISWRAGTGVAVHSLLTRPTILTREGQTVSRDTAAVLTVRT